MDMTNWIEVNVPVLVHRNDLPKMTAEQEEIFKDKLARELGEWLPSGSDWLDCLSFALDRAGLDTEPQDEASYT